MKKILISLVILAVVAASFKYPHLMFNPGQLVAGHQDLKNDCLACHAPFWGIDSKKCIGCHKPDEIGMHPLNGNQAAENQKNTLFHGKLKNTDCLACHSDHKGTNPGKSATTFNHNMIADTDMANCQACHIKPSDALHQPITANCSQCHTTEHWKPADFDHSAYFLLDNDHNTDCKTCHTTDNYKKYSCYGCHEHSESKMIEEHSEEGINNIADCISCHKSANKHDIRKGGSEGEGEESDD
jgi:hypothetical protein